MSGIDLVEGRRSKVEGQKTNANDECSGVLLYALQGDGQRRLRWWVGGRMQYAPTGGWV